MTHSSCSCLKLESNAAVKMRKLAWNVVLLSGRLKAVSKCLSGGEMSTNKQKKSLYWNIYIYIYMYIYADWCWLQSSLRAGHEVTFHTIDAVDTYSDLWPSCGKSRENHRVKGLYTLQTMFVKNTVHTGSDAGPNRWICNTGILLLQLYTHRIQLPVPELEFGLLWYINLLKHQTASVTNTYSSNWGYSSCITFVTPSL